MVKSAELPARSAELRAGSAVESSAGSLVWDRIDWLLLTLLAALCLAFISLQIRWNMTPIEDASMLLRYAQHFAQGHGIRWNVDQPPVDGATDFLFTVAIGTLARLAHIGVATASRLLNLSAHLLSVLLVFAGGRLLLGANRWLCAAAAAYLAAGPAVLMANGCFGAPFFAALLLACWCAGLWYARFRSTWGAGLCMSLLGLLAGLTRPEGVLIAIMLLAGTAYLARKRTSWRNCVPLVVSFTLVFGVLGGAYFIWRWHYFGYPLPNPFYVKGDGHLYPSSLHHAATNLVMLLAPALPLVPLGWLHSRTRPLAQVTTLLLIGFTLMWILLTNANNHFSRFQYAIVPLVLMTVPALASGVRLLFLPDPSDSPDLSNLSSSSASSSTRRPWAFPAACGLALALSLLYINRLFQNVDVAWGMRAFALRLQPLASKGYTMAVTEAGALPFYSQWRTIDGLGLNDSYVAHHGERLSASYLDRFHPEIIMDHIDRGVPAEFEPGGLGRPPQPGSAGWTQQLMNYYARSHGYTLAAVWGADACNLHVFWVRPGFPDYDTVLGDIRDHPYYFLDNGFLSHDYRNELDSIQNCALPAGPPP